MSHKKKIDHRPIYKAIRTVPIRYCNGSVIDYYNEHRPMEQVSEKVYRKYVQIVLNFYTNKIEFNKTALVSSEDKLDTYPALKAFKNRVNYFYTQVPMQLLNIIVENVGYYEDYTFNNSILPIESIMKSQYYIKALKEQLLNKDFTEQLPVAEFFLHNCFRRILKMEESILQKEPWENVILLNYVTFFPLIEFSTLLYYKSKLYDYLDMLKKHDLDDNKDLTRLKTNVTYSFIKKNYHAACCDKENFKTFFYNFQYLKDCYLDNKYLLSLNDKNRLFKFLVCFKVYQRVTLENKLEFNDDGFIMQNGHEDLLIKLYYQECKNYYPTFWGKSKKANFLPYIQEKMHSQFYTNTEDIKGETKNGSQKLVTEKTTIPFDKDQIKKNEAATEYVQREEIEKKIVKNLPANSPVKLKETSECNTSFDDEI